MPLPKVPLDVPDVNGPVNMQRATLAKQGQEVLNVAAGSTNTAFGGKGSFLKDITLIPASTTPGAVSIKDGSGASITLFAGGASSLADLKPFTVPINAIANEGFTITTGVSISALVTGKF